MEMGDGGDVEVEGEYIGETRNRDCRGKEEGEINVGGCEKRWM